MQHFKSIRAKIFFLSLIGKCGGPFKCMYVYCFKASWHGKGCHDGLGRAFKNKVHILIKSCKSSRTRKGIPGGGYGYIANATDVFQAWKHSLQTMTAEFVDELERDLSLSTIFISFHTRIHPIPCAEETLQPLVNKSKNYQFDVFTKGNMFMQNCTCWCLSCLKARYSIS